MKTKRKMCVTIDAEIFEAVEKAAQACNMGKSRLAQEAFGLWLKKRTGELMATGYTAMVGKDKHFADTTLFGQKEIL